MPTLSACGIFYRTSDRTSALNHRHLHAVKLATGCCLSYVVVDAHPTDACLIALWVTSKLAATIVSEDATRTFTVERVSERVVGTPPGRGADANPPFSGTIYPKLERYSTLVRRIQIWVAKSHPSRKSLHSPAHSFPMNLQSVDERGGPNP